MYRTLRQELPDKCVGVSRDKPAVDKQRKQTISKDVFQGVSYIVNFKPLFICVVFGLIPMFLAMPFQNLMVVFADNVWQVGEQGLGIMMGLSGLGGVIGSAWVAQRGERIDRVKLMVINSFLLEIVSMKYSGGMISFPLSSKPSSIKQC